MVLVSTNGAVKAMLPGDMLAPVADSHWPIAAPAPLNGGTGLIEAVGGPPRQDFVGDVLAPLEAALDILPRRRH